MRQFSGHVANFSAFFKVLVYFNISSRSSLFQMGSHSSPDWGQQIRMESPFPMEDKMAMVEPGLKWREIILHMMALVKRMLLSIGT